MENAHFDGRIQNIKFAMMRMFFFAIFTLLLFASCEKDVDLKLQEALPRLVVDARIENGQPPIVVLTKSIGYFNTFSLTTLSNLFVHNATININNGTTTHQLKEYYVELVPGIGYSYYSIDSANLATAFVGEANKQYHLSIEEGNRVYESSIGIPDFYDSLDSVWTKKAPFNPDTTLRILMVKSTDRPGRGNYIRYFTKINSGPFLPGENSVFDDQVIDGTTFTTQIDPGIDRNNPPKPDSNYFKKGDTITFKFCNIQKPVYQFWNTWEFAYQSLGNPFSQPNKVLGNISNGALGVFAGYACREKTIISD